MSAVKSLIRSMFHERVSRGTLAFEENVAEILVHAWIDNCDDKLYYATGPARKIFNETVGTYVRAYHARMHRFPEGQHDILGDGRRTIYFAPSVLRMRSNTSRILSPDIA